MSYIPTETYRHACSVDLYRYLLDMHPAEVKREGHSLVLTRDKHVSLKQGYHGYMNFSKGDKGKTRLLLTLEVPAVWMCIPADIPLFHKPPKQEK